PARPTSSHTLLEGVAREPVSRRLPGTRPAGSQQETMIEPDPGDGPPLWRWPAVAAGVLLAGLVLAWTTGLLKPKTREREIAGKSVPEGTPVLKNDTKTTIVETPGTQAPPMPLAAGDRGAGVPQVASKALGSQADVATPAKT